MPFFPAINLLYLHVPKTGGMSIEEYFFKKYEVNHINQYEKHIYGWYLDRSTKLRVPNECTLQHFTYRQICENHKYFGWNTEMNISVLISVRNPYDRIISDLFWGERIHANSTQIEVETELYKYLVLEKDSTNDNHKIPQIEYIMDGIPEVPLQKQHIQIVKTETLVEDMQRLGYTDFNKNKNKNNESPKKYIEYLSPNSIKQINEYYKMDFEYFGYDMILSEEIKQPNYNTTIVSAFVSNINENKNRNVEKYIEYGKKLLEIPNPKVIFMDGETYESFFQTNQHEYPLTTFIPIQKTDIYLYNYKDEITEFHLNTGNHEKDTMEYIFVQCNKTEWVRQTIDLNIYKTNQYIWIDFGIYHMLEKEDKEKNVFKKCIQEMTEKTYDKVRIASCKYKGYVYPYNIYDTITYTFAGSVFGGDAHSLLKFAYLVKSEILQLIQEKHILMWELNVWYLVDKKEPELMDFYKCAHGMRILDQY